MKREQLNKMYKAYEIARDTMPENFKPVIQDFIEGMFYQMELRGYLLSDYELKRIINLLNYSLARYTKDYDGM